MSLYERISEDYKSALKGGDRTKLSILRMVKSAIKNREIEKGDALNDDDIYAILNSFVKRARESIEQFSSAGRGDLADKEKAELGVVQAYLPEQLSEAETREAVSAVIAETGASGLKDTGIVMKSLLSKYKGRLDGKLANSIVREMLEAK